MRNEPPLASGFRNVPAVFPGIDTYHAIQAQVTFTDTLGTAATTPRDAIGAVVQILRCDDFGCDTPVGTGVIVHPSGLILTAYHVLLEDPNDLRSDDYPDFVIALTENVRTPPRPRYLASVVADKNEQDIALLAIDRTFNRELAGGEEIAPGSLTLPALPFADVNLLFGATLTVLGFPLDGGDAVSNFPATFTSFDDKGRLIVVDRLLRPGNSGGPALALQDGRLAIAGLVIRGRSTQGSLAEEGLLRAIDQVTALYWPPGVTRALGQNINIVEHSEDGEQRLQITIDLSTFDLVDANLRLLFYVTDEMGQPWQQPGTAGPLVLWANVRPSQVIDTQTINLTVPIAELGTSADRLRFHGLLWDRNNLLSLWTGAAGVQTDQAGALAVPATTPAPVTVAPPHQPTMTPTVDQSATAAAVETAAAATLAALNTPTPTVDLVAARLTEIARTTATSTPTFTRTRISVPELTKEPIEEPTVKPIEEPTAIPVEEPTEKPAEEPTHTPIAPKAGEAREFGGIRFVYVPAGPFVMGRSDQQVDAAFELCKTYGGDACLRSLHEIEQPQSTIETAAFWIMETEVTNVPYRAYVEATKASEPVCFDDSKIWNNSDLNGDEQPVVCISWHDAVAYAEWLSAQTGLQIRLPTEAEWEKAARGPSTSLGDGQVFPWGDDWVASNLNFCDTNCEYDWKDKATDDGFATTAPVKSFPNGKSPYNAFDMAGNVWEWTSTIYDNERFPYPYKVDDREALEGDARRVVRGGSWDSPPYIAHSALRLPPRDLDTPDVRDLNVGVRLVVSPGS